MQTTVYMRPVHCITLWSKGVGLVFEWNFWYCSTGIWIRNHFWVGILLIIIRIELHVHSSCFTFEFVCVHADTVTVQYERADCWSFIFCTSFCRSPDKCSIYYVGSCLFVASNIYIYISDFAFWFYLFCYIGARGQPRDVLHCGQVVQEREEWTPTGAIICGYDKYIQ